MTFPDILRHSLTASPAPGIRHRMPKLATPRTMATHTAKGVALGDLPTCRRAISSRAELDEPASKRGILPRSYLTHPAMR